MHYEIGGSIAARILACPGSVSLTRHLERGESSAAADRGTMLHEVMDKLHAGASMKLLTRDLTQADTLAVKKAWVARNKLVDGFPHVHAERQVVFPGIPNSGGTADVFAWNRILAACGDYKFGSRIVDVINNAQAWFYAAAAIESRVFPKTVKNVIVAIIQPDARPVLSKQLVTVKQLLVFRDKLARTAEVARGKNPPFAMGEHCLYCPAKNKTCPLGKPMVSSDPSQQLAVNLSNLKFRI